MTLEDKLKHKQKKQETESQPNFKIPIINSVKNYPSGRGKFITISEKSILEPNKKSKHQPNFIHHSIKMNPHNLQIKEYYGERKDVYVFAEGIAKLLSEEERLDFATSLLASINYIYSYTNVHEIGSKIKRSYRTRQLNRLIKIKMEKYRKWRKKIEKQK